MGRSKRSTREAPSYARPRDTPLFNKRRFPDGSPQTVDSNSPPRDQHDYGIEDDSTYEPVLDEAVLASERPPALNLPATHAGSTRHDFSAVDFASSVIEQMQSAYLNGSESAEEISGSEHSGLDNLLDLLDAPADRDPDPFFVENDAPIGDGLARTTAEFLVLLAAIVDSEPTCSRSVHDRYYSLFKDTFKLNIPNNVSGLMRKLRVGETFVIRDFCPDCNYVYKLDGETKCPTPSCPGPPRNTPSGTSSNFFVTIPIDVALQVLYRRRKFYRNSKHIFKHFVDYPGRLPDDIQDCYDGEILRKLHHEGWFHDKNYGDVALGACTDGSPVFKRSGLSAWPLAGIVFNLPPEQRYKAGNMPIFGVVFSQGHPNMVGLLHDFVADLKRLNRPSPDAPARPLHFTQATALSDVVRSVITVKRKDGGDFELPLRVRLVAMPMDLRAREQVLNHAGCNSHYACPVCFVKGEITERRLWFPASVNWRLRDRQSTEVCRTIATAPDIVHICGWRRGSSILEALPDDDFPTVAHTDSMHHIYINLVRFLLVLLVHADYQNQPFSLYNRRDVMNARIKKLDVPHSRMEPPRSLDLLDKWKAAELRAFLFYYWPTVFGDLLTASVLLLWAMLTNAVAYLSGSRISRKEISGQMSLPQAHKQLVMFIEEFPHVFGQQELGLSVHLLAHTSMTVHLFGPLWASNCFAYETIMGWVVRGHHTRRSGHAGSVAKRFFSKMRLLQLAESCCADNPSMVDSLAKVAPALLTSIGADTDEDMEAASLRLICDGTYELARPRPIILDQQLVIKLAVAVDSPMPTHRAIPVQQYARVYRNGEVLYSTAFRRVHGSRRFSACAAYSLDGVSTLYGLVRYFVSLPSTFLASDEGGAHRCYALVHQIRAVSGSAELPGLAWLKTMKFGKSVERYVNEDDLIQHIDELIFVPIEAILHTAIYHDGRELAPLDEQTRAENQVAHTSYVMDYVYRSPLSLTHAAVRQQMPYREFM